ncbi:MAG: ExbD/TolR family protein [Desulfosalsimonadaceae bacterium]
MAFDTNQRSLLSDINVTPFVDVMLVLLIVFMVAAPMMVQGVDVSLPKTQHATSLDQVEDPLVVVINSEGGISINETDVSVDGLGEKLSFILENRSSRNVFLRADTSVDYGTVVLVMSEIKRAGVQQLGVVTEPVGSLDEDAKREKSR